METLVVAQHHHHHQSQYYSRRSSHNSDTFGSSSSRGFREINCRTFQSGSGILPTPFNSFDSPPPVPNKGVLASPNSVQSVKPNCDKDEHSKNSGNSRPIPISSIKDRSFSDDFSYSSELWAGPAYSNSPPPSSLPLPKFSLRQKRSVSFELPSPPETTVHHFAKSAPSSPTRESSKSANNFFLNIDSATKDLRRILNLDTSDE